MGLDEKGENGIGRRERSEEEKETCKVTVAQTQKREEDGQTIGECTRLMEGKEEAVGLGIKLVSEII